MHIDWSISLGNLLEVFGFVVGGLAFMFAIRSDVATLQQSETGLVERVKGVEERVRDISLTMIELARQDERLNAHSQRIGVLETWCTSLEKVAHARSII